MTALEVSADEDTHVEPKHNVAMLLRLLNDDGRSWIALAACRGMEREIFFPTRGQWDRERQAKATCAQCVVRDECLDDALAGNMRFGIWGGTSERQRRGMRRTRDAGSQTPDTHCRSGHEFTAENTYIVRGSGRRQCRTCHREQERRRRA